jgi:YD repeat-containing protein
MPAKSHTDAPVLNMSTIRPLRALRSGRSIIRIKYDERNLKVEESSFDEHDDPVETKDGRWSVRQWTFDTSGQLTKIILRDTAGNVACTRFG